MDERVQAPAHGQARRHPTGQLAVFHSPLPDVLRNLKPARILAKPARSDMEPHSRSEEP
jgi:hypothetical protein